MNCLCFGPKSNQVLATGGEDHKVNIWRVGSVSNIWTLGYNKSPIECLCFDSEELCVVSGAMNGSLKVFDLNEGRLARNLGSHSVNATTLQYHPYGEFVVSGSVDCTMKVWDVRNKTCIQTYNGHSKELTCVRFSPDGKWVASSSKDGQILLWDLVAGKLINSIKIQPNYVRSFEFNPTEFTMAAVTSARTVKFWDLETMNPLYYTPPESSPVRAIAYSNLGSVLCTAAKDSMKMWELDPTLKLHSVVETGWDKVRDMKISNNFQLVAGSCVSNFVSIWSVDLEQYLTGNRDEDKVTPTSQPPGAYTSRDAKAEYGDGVGGVDRQGSQQQQQSRAAASAQSRQLEGVRNQLSQLSSDLGLPQGPTGTDRDQQQGQRGSRSRGGSGAGPAAGAAAVGTDNGSASSDSEVSTGASRPPRAMSRSESKYDADVSSWEGPDCKGQGGPAGRGRLEEIPEVVWDDGQSPADMASSMGESFWNRFKQQGGAVAAAAAEAGGRGDGDGIAASREAARAAAALKADLEGDDFDPEDDGWGDDKSVESLKQMLPPAAYDDDSKGGAPSRLQQQSSSSSGGWGEADVKESPSRLRTAVAANARANPPPTGDSWDRDLDPGRGRDKDAADYDMIVRELPKKPAVPVFAKAPAGAGAGAGYRGSEEKASAVGGVYGAAGLGSKAEPPLQIVGTRPTTADVGGAAAKVPAVVARRLSAEASSAAASSSSGSGGNSSNGALSDLRKCDDLLDRLQASSGPTAVDLAQRLSSLKILRQLWLRGEVSDAIEHLTILGDALPHTPANLYTLADFFNAVELRGNGLNLDSCLRLLPVLESMVSAPQGLVSEHVVYSAYQSFGSLGEGFGELIQSTRSVISTGGTGLGPGGVDLSREARLNKCNACHDIFTRVANRVDTLRRKFRISKVVVEVLDSYASLCALYFTR